MNGKVIGGLIALVVLGAAGFVVLGGEDNAGSPSDPNTNQSQPATPGGSEGNLGVDRFFEFSDMTLADSSDTKRVLFFHANWCSTCKAFEQEIEAQGVPEGITILRANYDNDTDLRRQYDVSVQSTFILIDENEEEVMRWPFGAGLSGIRDLYEQVQSS